MHTILVEITLKNGKEKRFTLGPEDLKQFKLSMKSGEVFIAYYSASDSVIINCQDVSFANYNVHLEKN